MRQKAGGCIAFRYLAFKQIPRVDQPVSKDIQYSKIFRDASKIETLRKDVINNNTLIQDMKFKSLCQSIQGQVNL